MMKTILALIALFSIKLAVGQDAKLVMRDSLSPQKIKVVRNKVIFTKEEAKMPIGDFVIDSYQVLTKQAPKKRDLEQLKGTLVRLKDTDITGDLIDPISIEDLGIERMTKEDYLFRAFGDQLLDNAEQLPSSIRVRKTGRPDCYGVVVISKFELALPYKGTLLFLKIK